MKFSKRLAPFILALVLIAANLVPISAATNVSVILNGQYLSYREVAPQIVNNRTMVPLSETATYLGMTYTWNDASRTMYFTKGNRTMVHVLGSSVITIIINGVQQTYTYDTPSQSIGGRTVMPISMLADTIGATVDWNPNTYTVTITTVTDPEIISVLPSTTNVSVDENVTVNVTTNSSTASVRLFDSNHNNLATGTQYTDVGANRMFTVTYKPTTTGTQSLYVYGSSDGAMFSDKNSKSFTITVSGNLSISSIEASKTSIATNKDVTITVYTNESVSRVKLVDGYNDKEVVETSFSTSGSQRIFKFTVSSSSARTIKYTAYAGTSSDFSNSVSKTVSVTYGGSGNKTTSSNISIESKTSGKNKIITVITYDDINRVELRNSTGRNIEDYIDLDGAEYYSSTKLKWEFSVKTSDLEGKYYIYAYYDYDNDEDNYVSKSYTVGDDKDEIIYDFEVDGGTTGWHLGDQIDIVFYTDETLENVYFVDPNNGQLNCTLGPRLVNKSDGRWRAIFDFTGAGTYTLHYTDSDDKNYTKTFKLSGEAGKW